MLGLSFHLRVGTGLPMVLPMMTTPLPAQDEITELADKIRVLTGNRAVILDCSVTGSEGETRIAAADGGEIMMLGQCSLVGHLSISPSE